MFDVNIYIETSIKGLRTYKKAAGMYVLECIDGNRILGTKDGLIYAENITEYALTLELLHEAFSRMTKSSSVRVNTECGHVFGTINNHQLSKWKKNGWITARGTPVKNKEIWIPLSEKMEMHLVTAEHWANSYGNLMQTAIRKELQAWHSEPVAKKRDILEIKED